MQAAPGTFSRVIVIMALSSASSSDRQDLYDRVEHHYADSDGVRIHYVTAGFARLGKSLRMITLSNRDG